MATTESGLRRPTLEDAASYPSPGMVAPTALAYSPDDQLIGYLYSAEGTLAQGLYVYDVQAGEHRAVWIPGMEAGTGNASLPAEERLRRERARVLMTGVTQFAWTGQGQQMLVPHNGGLYVIDAPGASPRLLIAGQGKAILDPQASPDGSTVAYVQDAELYVVPTAGGVARQLTFGARETGVSHGLAEYVAQEEMRRFRGYWWSPDSRLLAFTEVDETRVPPYTIVHQGQDETGVAAQEVHRYPFAGQDNARVRLGVVPACGGEPVWMDLGSEQSEYVTRVNWAPDGALWVQIEERDQSILRLLRADPTTGAARCMLVEHNPVWINLHDMLCILRDRRFIWASERSGYMHLYLYSPSGGEICALTEGSWVVDSIACVDEHRGRVYFVANRDAPTEKHLYRVGLEGGEPSRLTAERGTHLVVAGRSLSSFIETYSALDQPPMVRLCSLEDGHVLATLYEPADPRLAAIDLRPPEIIELTTEDGVTLYGALYRPGPEAGDGPHPLIVSVYGGPHAQAVTRAWSLTADMRAQFLHSRGYLVLKLDNRGSARRGLAFEGAIRFHMGDVEVRDQVEGVRWLVAQGLADPQRVGIYGWSYGGYMAAMCLMRAPETFRVAVSGAPVTHWDGYDTFYTERYMGMPSANSEGYRLSSVMAHVEQMRGHLLLIHGLIDENVHFRHTARLIRALMRAGKPHDLLMLPDTRHSPRGQQDRLYVEERLMGYFDQHL